MSPELKINSNLFGSLNEIINTPFMLMDNMGNVLSFNKEADLLFHFVQDYNNIYNLLDDPSCEIVNGLIEKLFSNSVPVIQLTNLRLKSGQEIKGEILLYIYNEQNEYYILFSLKKSELSAPLSLSKITIWNLDLGKMISNPEILEPIEDVRQNFPFSLIGKETFRKKIDKLDEPFWIEDIKENYFIVNSSLAKHTGVKTQQMEGNQVNSFLIPVLGSLYQAINNYIRDSGNSIIIKGVTFKGMDNSGQYETIKCPLFDSEHNFIATIGITKKTEKNKEELSLILDPFPFPVAHINKKEEICRLNSPFASLLNKDQITLLNKNYRDVFSDELAKQIIDFQEGDKNKAKLLFRGKFDNNRRNSDSFNVYLSKLFSKVNEPEGFLIFIEEDSSNNDFENLLKRRGTMFDILIQNNPEPIFIYDTENLRFLEVNKAALNLYGYKKDEFLQMDFTDLYTPEDIQTLLDSSNSPDKLGKFTGPYKHKTKDGASVFVEISKFEFKFNDKDAHFNIVRDVTQRLETEKKNQLYKSAFDNSQSLLFITDNTGFITFVNNVVLEVLDYSKADIEKNSFASLVRNEDRGAISSSVFQTHMTDSVSLNMDLKKADGSFIPAELTATPIINYKGEIDSFIIIGKIEQEVIVKEIIKEVEVEKTVDDSVNMSPIYSPKVINEDFLSSMFHEILTPINVIIGFVQELTENDSNLSPEQKEASDIINQNRETLLNTMNSIIEYSNMGKDNYELKSQNISITEIIDFLQKDIQELAGNSGVDFAYGKISSSLRFESDKLKFQHLISLLLRVIIQLTKEKKIYFSAYQADQDNFVISIKDSYSSVSDYLMENLKLLFGDSEVGKGKDFGISRLTLRLAKKLLSLLKGQFEVLTKGDKSDYGFIFPLSFITVQAMDEKSVLLIEKDEKPIVVPHVIPEEIHEEISEVMPEVKEEVTQEKPKHKITEDGFEEVPSSRIITSKFTFDEPEIEKPEPVKFDEELINLEKEIREIKPFKTSEKLNLSMISCLYLEDQIDSQILYKVQMKELKEIKFAVSFEEAMPLLDNEQFDFIVIDINLQGEYNGLDALKIIRKMPSYTKTPIVAVTAYVLPGDREKFIAAGFNDFISKPIFREKMVDSLERIFFT
jgi:PAS domain S-box-containing protein